MKEESKNLEIVFALLEQVELSAEQQTKLVEKITKKKGKRKLILRKQVLEMLGVSRPTLAQYIADGKINPIRYSARKIRFDLHEVESFLENGCKMINNNK